MYLEQIAARLTLPQKTVEAMRPYKPKTPTQLRQKTDPTHRMMREAYKRRTGSDKAKQSRYRAQYVRKNASQLKQRSKRSRMLHGADALSASSNPGQMGNWCYEYVWSDGLLYSIVIHGTRLEADCNAQRLGLRYGGELLAVYPADNDLVEQIKTCLPLAAQYENTPGNKQTRASIYAGRARLVSEVGNSRKNS